MTYKFTEAESKSNSLYNQSYSSNYRRYDEEYVKEEDYKHFTSRLKELTGKFNAGISVLDIGCGTGRYFHCLLNTTKLTGIDISTHMLEEAQNPLFKEHINNRETTLIEGNVFNKELNGRTFDFIYSIGVLGEHVPFEEETGARIFSLLKPGGIAYFTIVDLDARKSFLRKTVELFFPLFPGFLKRKLNERWKINYLTRKQLNSILSASMPGKAEILIHKSFGEAWTGVHFECIIYKGK